MRSVRRFSQLSGATGSVERLDERVQIQRLFPRKVERAALLQLFVDSDVNSRLLRRQFPVTNVRHRSRQHGG